MTGELKGKPRKSFFSGEKKQKTFVLRPWPGCREAMAGEQKFFGSFFQKRTLFPRVCCLLAGLLPGCASEPPAHIYLLATPAESVADTPQSGADVQLQPVLIPDYLDTTDILLRTGPHQVKASVAGEWGERLSAGIAHALRADLAARLPEDRVTLGPPTDATAQQILLTVDALDMWPDGHCVLIAHWRTGVHAAQGAFAHAAAAQATDESRVALLAGLVEDLAKRIARDERRDADR